MATIQCALQSEATLGFFVRNTFGPVELGQSGFDFGEEYEPFNGVVNGGVWRHCLERLDNAIARKWLRHGSIVMHISTQAEVSAQHCANFAISATVVCPSLKIVC